ncbi:MAG TPA: hypothetical protein DIT07_05460, partial [Sphingobacteriaceae bacterium]|nr:hypothetical protein [Sphingobacteriaceae bacterium]
ARQRIYQKQNMSGMTALGLVELIKNKPDNLGNYIELSQLYYSSGYKDKALSVLQDAKRADQGNAAVRINLANIYRLEGKPEDAFTELKSALENPGMDIESKINIVLAQAAQSGEAEIMKQATDLAAILVKLYPRNVKIRSVYGDILLQDKKSSEARQSYIDALKLNDKEYSVWESLIRMDIAESDYAVAVQDGEKALNIFPGNTALYFYIGKAYFYESDYEKAIGCFKNAEGHETENKQLLSQICSGLGDSYQALRRHKESDEAYEKALQINPDNAEALNKYATSLSLRSGDYLANAQQMSHRATELDPDNAEFKKTYDRIAFLDGKYRSAVSWVESSMGGLELSSQDYLVWENIIRIEYEISDFDDLIENVGKTIIIFPDQAAPYLYIGLTYIQKKNYEKAKDYLQKAANLQKDNKELQTLIYSGFGDLYKTLNNNAESDKAYEKALQIDPYNLYALNSYAYGLLIRRVNLDKAERVAQQANDLEPGNPFYEDTYSQVLFRQKKYKEARMWIEKAISHDNGSNAALFEHYGDILIFLTETESAVQQWTKAKSAGMKSEKLERKINGKKYVE